MSEQRNPPTISTFFIALWLFLMALDIAKIPDILTRIAVALERLATK